MGDVAMLLPVISVLKNKYPDLRITLVTQKLFATFFEDLDGVLDSL